MIDPKSPLVQSIAGFTAAVIVGALLPRTLGYLIKRVLFTSLRQAVAVAAFGLVAERLTHWIATLPEPKTD